MHVELDKNIISRNEIKRWLINPPSIIHVYYVPVPFVVYMYGWHYEEGRHGEERVRPVLHSATTAAMIMMMMMMMTTTSHIVI